MADTTKLDHLNLDLDKDGKKEQYNLTDYRLGTEDVADVSEAEAEYNYTYTDYTAINSMPTMVMREKSKVNAFFGWVKGTLLTVESMTSVAYDRVKNLVTYSFSTGEDKDGAINVTKFSGGLVTSEDVQISNYGDTDISDIGDGTLTGAIKAASESGGGLRIVPINQEAYAELPQDQQDRDDIIWDVYDEDYEVTSKDIFFDWSGTTLTEDNVEDVIKQVNDKTDENTNVISTLNSTLNKITNILGGYEYGVTLDSISYKYKKPFYTYIIHGENITGLPSEFGANNNVEIRLTPYNDNGSWCRFVVYDLNNSTMATIVKLNNSYKDWKVI